SALKRPTSPAISATSRTIITRSSSRIPTPAAYAVRRSPDDVAHRRRGRAGERRDPGAALRHRRTARVHLRARLAAGRLPDVGQPLHHPRPHRLSQGRASAASPLHGRRRTAARIEASPVCEWHSKAPPPATITETSMSSARLPVLDKFIADLRTIWSGDPDNQRRMDKAKPLLEQLVKDDGLRAHSATWPSTEGYKNLLLYVDSDHHFTINAVVRAPGRTGSVHDHADAWVLYGVLDGSESLERYERVDDGRRPGYAEVRLASVTTGTQGKVDLVAPGAIHAEQGGPTRSVAIIVRSQRLGQGTVVQHTYDPKAKTVIGP